MTARSVATPNLGALVSKGDSKSPKITLLRNGAVTG